MRECPGRVRYVAASEQTGSGDCGVSRELQPHATTSQTTLAKNTVATGRAKRGKGRNSKEPNSSEIRSPAPRLAMEVSSSRPSHRRGSPTPAFARGCQLE